ncbi:MAG: hypothetical protein Fur0020_05850 [Thermodesulfovibrionia bacterium]
MSGGARLFILITGIILFVVVFELVRKKRFREELSIIWLFFAVVVALGSVIDIIVDPLARLLRIHYPPALVFVLITIFLVVSLLYFSLVTSDLKSKVKELTQKIALLEFEISQKVDKKG